MRADLRWTMAWLAGGLIFAPAAALAQSTTSAPPSTQPISNAIGPSELQNFSLSGSVTKPADQQPSANAPAAAPPATSTARATSAAPHRTVESRPSLQQVAQRNPAPALKPPPLVHSAPSSATAPPPPFETTSSAPVPAPTAQPALPGVEAPSQPAGTLAPERRFSILPWLLAAFVLAAATLFLLWRRHSREAVAVGQQFDLFVPPEPAPAPPPGTPRAPPPRAAAPQHDPTPKPASSGPKGIVSTRLRPTVELSVQPLRCIVDEERVVIECELELFNTGAAPARGLIAEASLFNAGATQEQDLAAFFANPVGAGERLDALPPMQRVTFTSQVIAPRAAMQEYELAGRKALVPVLAFNALYEWSGKQAQTSAAYLVGRETNSEKLGPLGLKGGAHEFRKLGARVLPTSLRS